LDKGQVEIFSKSDVRLKEQFGCCRATPLPLKNLHLSAASFEILCFVPHNRITTLFLERGSVDIENWVVCHLSNFRSFPSRQRVSFVGSNIRCSLFLSPARTTSLTYVLQQLFLRISKSHPGVILTKFPTSIGDGFCPCSLSSTPHEISPITH